jgi:hypothetical protein
MLELPSLLSGRDEHPWSSSRLIRRRPSVDDHDDVDIQETPSEPTLVAEFTAADGDDGGDIIITQPPLGDQDRLYGEY